jgi:hypothetical protein
MHVVQLADKLQLKPGQPVTLAGVADPVPRELKALARRTDGDLPAALVALVANRAALKSLQARVVTSAKRDALTWVAYPKAGQLGTDLNRDELAAALMERGVRPVRQIAIDDVWSALRFRPG